MKSMKVKFTLAFVAILSMKIFCSGNSLSAKVKDAMVRNHRAHVVRLIPFLDENNIQFAAPVLGSESTSQSKIRSFFVVQKAGKDKLIFRSATVRTRQQDSYFCGRKPTWIYIIGCDRFEWRRRRFYQSLGRWGKVPTIASRFPFQLSFSSLSGSLSCLINVSILNIL